MRILPLLLLATALCGALATTAHAGSYVVVGCSDLGGGATRPANGWYLAAGVFPSADQCPQRGGLYATGERTPNLFRFDAPPGTTIARLVSTYRAHLSGAASWAVPTFVVQAGHGGEWEYIPPARGSIAPGPLDLGSDRAAGAAHGADALRIGVRCDLAGPCTDGGQPWARFFSLAVELTDVRPPSASLSGPGGHLQGDVQLRLAARDAGGGVYSRSVDVDGRPRATASLCATVPATLGALRHFTDRVPCPLDASTTVALDTRTLGDGPHSVVATVEDAAGNARAATAPIVVDNLPPRAGIVALAGDPAEALTAQPSGFRGEDVAYDYRWERCDDAGCAEIGGAVSRTYVTRARDAGHRLRAVVAATDGGGTVRVASAPSAPVPQAAAPLADPPRVVEDPRVRLTAWLERGRRRLHRTTVTWPTRVRVRGRLTDLAGRPLARTPVRMLERVTGGRWRPITGIVSRRDGRLTTFTRLGPSRRIRLVHGNAAVTLRVTVRASVRVRVRRGRGFTLVSGRVRGGQVPRAGVRVLLQSRTAAGWRTRARLRTDGLGRFSASGRAPRRARLRVVLPAQRGYPYARGVGRP